MFFLGELQEWPEEDYPPYANGPGYIMSSDIAKFIVSEFEKHKLRVCDHCVSVCMHTDCCMLVTGQLKVMASTIY